MSTRPQLTNVELHEAIRQTHELLHDTAQSDQFSKVRLWLTIHLDALLDEQRMRAKGIGTAPVAVAI